MVVGDRQVETIEHFSAPKKMLQRLGSWVVRHASSTEIPDTTSGFRAYNREAALQVQAVSKFTYTLETIIQAGRLQVAVDHVPIRTNPKTRESRLFPSTAAYVRRNALSIFRVYSQYQPLRVFWTGALILGVAAMAIFLRFLIFFVQHPDAGTRPHPGADRGRRAVQRGDAARRARRDRGSARRAADPVAAHVRAGPADRAAARGRAVALRAGSASGQDHERGPSRARDRSPGWQRPRCRAGRGRQRPRCRGRQRPRAGATATAPAGATATARRGQAPPTARRSGYESRSGGRVRRRRPESPYQPATPSTSTARRTRSCAA